MDRDTELHLLALEQAGRPLPGVNIEKHATSGRWRWLKHDGTYLKSQSQYKYNSLMEALNASH